MSEISARLLIVEADSAMRDRLTANFEQAGYAVRACKTTDGVADEVAAGGADLCLIDIDPPGGDGLALTGELRAASHVGIILITGSDDPVDRIIGLESGADDCITKPFDVRELLSRVKNLLRRVRGQRQRETSGRRFAGWTLDVHRRVLSAPDGERQTLSGAEFNLLLALIDNAGQVMTRDQLMNRLRNRDWHPEDRYIDVLVAQVRRKFRRHDGDAGFITTIHGAGYLFAPVVT